MNDKPLGRRVIQHGRKYRTRAGAIGGVNAYLDDDGRPTAILAIMPDGEYESGRQFLHVGETFELGPELWEVTEIEAPNRTYWATVVNQLR